MTSKWQCKVLIKIKAKKGCMTMAKKSKSVSLKNVTVDLDDMTFTEVSKDEMHEYNIMDILADWDNQDGVSITIRKEADF